MIGLEMSDLLLLGGQPAAVKPGRAEILASCLKGDIAPTYIPEIWNKQGRTVRAVRWPPRWARTRIERADDPAYVGEGEDILGTWHWLDFDDALFHTAATAYRAYGNRCLAVSMQVTDYQGRSFDLTQDIPLLKARLERCYRYGLVPIVCVQLVDQGGHGAETLERLPALIDAVGADLLRAVFTAWELVVDGGMSQFTGPEHESLLELLRRKLPDCVIGVEFATPPDHDPITYDGRVTPNGEEAAWWYEHAGGRYVDVLMLEVCYERFDDLPRFVDDVNGCICRFQGTWGSTEPNWSVDYHLGKTVVCFEYGAWLRKSTEEKRERREAVQYSGAPLRGWGEG